jgi:hypothetical protein
MLHSISSSLTWLFYLYFTKSECYEAPHYALLSSLSLRPSSVQIFSSALCSQILSVKGVHELSI